MVIRAPLTMMNWISSKAESSSGLLMEGKILEWCGLEFLHEQTVVANGSVAFCIEDISQLPKLLTLPLIEAPTEL